MQQPSHACRFPFQRSGPQRASLYGVRRLRLMRTFGMDEPMRCYYISRLPTPSCFGAPTWRDASDPVDATNDRRLSHPHVKVAVLSTFTHLSSDLADIPIVFKPGTDLAILNYIANHIISTRRVNQDFVNKHTSFVKGAVDIGYGLRAEHPLQSKAKAPSTRRNAAHRLRGLRSICEGLHAR